MSLDWLHITSSHLLSNDTWCAYTGIVIAVLLWSFDKPTSSRGKHIFLPLWMAFVFINTIAGLCFFLNRISLGKYLLVFDLGSLLVGLVFICIIYIITHVRILRESRIGRGIGRIMREGNIHDNIWKEDYF